MTDKMDSKDALNVIAEHYGIDGQLEKTEEELIELLHAIREYRKYKVKGEPPKYIPANIIEEMADVLVMITQLLFLFGGNSITRLVETVRFKIARQLHRIYEEKKNEQKV